MFIDLSTYEIRTLLEKGSTNQRNFIKSLTYEEFDLFIEVASNEEFFDYRTDDLRGLLNGGLLHVTDDAEEIEENENYIILQLNDKAILLM